MPQAARRCGRWEENRGALAEAAMDVVAGERLLGGGKKCLGRSVFQEGAGVEEARGIGNAPGLVEIVRHDDNREVITQAKQRLFNMVGGDGVQLRTWFIEEENGRLYGESPGNAQALLLAARETES